MNMRYKIFLSLITVLLLISCKDKPTIASKDYIYEKLLFETHNISFEIHLENIENSEKINKIIKNLIYQGNNFDEYIKHRENKFTENIREINYPLILNDDGTQYIHNSILNETYSIIFNNDLFIIFEYKMYFYISKAAHGNYLVNYLIIDLSEEKILSIDELMEEIPDELLIGFIELKYDINNFLRENIWPPDAINFAEGFVELVWNTYSITPYSYGIISIKLNIDEDIPTQYLTEKGKELVRIVNKLK